MAERDYTRDPAGEIPGVIQKAAHLATHELTDADMAAINKYALEPLTADQVFVFKAVLCDNEVDRQHERFTVKALTDLKKLFLGKTVIKDHRHIADNQVARIYATELVETGKATKSGENYTQLVAWCYMVKTASNADLIAEIKGGIKKEGSVGFSASSAICSICETDNAKTYCRHWPGRSYDKAGGPQVCIFTLAGAKDAYEFSLVAVPAQRAAGVSKSYTGETFKEVDESEAQDPEQRAPDTKSVEDVLAIRARLAASRVNTITE